MDTHFFWDPLEVSPILYKLCTVGTQAKQDVCSQELGKGLELDTVLTECRLSPSWALSPEKQSSCLASVCLQPLPGATPQVPIASLPTLDFPAMASPSFIISHALAVLSRQMGNVGAQLPWLPEQTDLLGSAPIHFRESNFLKNPTQTAFRKNQTQLAEKCDHSHQGWEMHQIKLPTKSELLLNH